MINKFSTINESYNIESKNVANNNTQCCTLSQKEIINAVFIESYTGTGTGESDHSGRRPGGDPRLVTLLWAAMNKNDIVVMLGGGFDFQAANRRKGAEYPCSRHNQSLWPLIRKS